MTYYWRRIGAYIIDLSVISMISQIIFSFISSKLVLTGTDLVTDMIVMYAFLLITVMIAVFYNVVSYHFFNYPLGKLLLSIQVLDENQKRLSTAEYATRELYKYVLTYATLGVYLPYQFLRYVVTKRQTFHDKKANSHIFI